MGISINQAFPSKWLKADDLRGKKVKCTISSVEMEKIGDDTKPVMYFDGKDKGVVLNKTNGAKIAMHYGDNTDDWIGREVFIFPDTVNFQGNMVPCIRVSVPIQEAAEDETIPF